MTSRFKFRAWNGETMISPDYITRDGRGCWKENSIPTGSDKLMQWAGLKDITGVDVYEGDFVSYKRERAKKAIVRWDAEGCCFMLGEDEIGINIKDLYVLGNVSQNPELLK